MTSELFCCVLFNQCEPVTREMQEQLHGRAQEMMRSHVVTAAACHRKHQHRDALLARIDMDASLLLSTSVAGFFTLAIVS